MPTLMGLMGLADAVPAVVEGTNYAAAFLGQPCERPNAAFYFYTAPQLPGQPDRRGLRTDRYTFVVIRHPQGDEFVLHDNQRDPYQLENIAGQQPDIVRTLTQELNRWLERTNDPFSALLRPQPD
jgi:hypothetical protein